MQLIIETIVNQALPQVAAGFTESLFKALAPPFPKIELERFDGCQTGDVVAMTINFGVARQRWVSEITNHGSSESGWFFIDEGRKLPAPLTYWRHRHMLTALPTGNTRITDHIIYRTYNPALDYLYYPALLAQFAYRKPVYKKYFK